VQVLNYNYIFSSLGARSFHTHQYKLTKIRILYIYGIYYLGLGLIHCSLCVLQFVYEMTRTPA